LQAFRKRTRDDNLLGTGNIKTGTSKQASPNWLRQSTVNIRKPTCPVLSNSIPVRLSNGPVFKWFGSYFVQTIRKPDKFVRFLNGMNKMAAKPFQDQTNLSGF
jgi:hypothetical protein